MCPISRTERFDLVGAALGGSQATVRSRVGAVAAVRRTQQRRAPLRTRRSGWLCVAPRCDAEAPQPCGPLEAVPPRQLRWSPSLHPLFPPHHRTAVRTVLLLHRRPGTLFSRLPIDVLLTSVLPALSLMSEAAPPRRLSAHSLCGRGRVVRLAPRSSGRATGTRKSFRTPQVIDPDSVYDSDSDADEAWPDHW